MVEGARIVRLNGGGWCSFFVKEVMPIVKSTPFLLSLGKMIMYQPYNIVIGTRSDKQCQSML